jgi:hypothetical protein
MGQVDVLVNKRTIVFDSGKDERIAMFSSIWTELRSILDTRSCFNRLQTIFKL